MEDYYKEFLDRRQIKIDFDLKKKVFRLSVPIFSTRMALPDSVKKYIDSMKDQAFKPHCTSYKIEGSSSVTLTQEFPFQWGFQPTIRGQIEEFSKLSKHCRRLLSEIAFEDRCKTAYLFLD
jgi:hypothetical protein